MSDKPSEEIVGPGPEQVNVRRDRTLEEQKRLEQEGKERQRATGGYPHSGHVEKRG